MLENGKKNKNTLLMVGIISGVLLLAGLVYQRAVNGSFFRLNDAQAASTPTTLSMVQLNFRVLVNCTPLADDIIKVYDSNSTPLAHGRTNSSGQLTLYIQPGIPGFMGFTSQLSNGTYHFAGTFFDPTQPSVVTLNVFWGTQTCPGTL